MMGRLTDDMTRLVGEIHMGHEERGRFVRDIKDNVAAMRATFRAANVERVRTVRDIKDNVAAMRATFRAANAERVRTVRGQMLKETADEMAGAHKAWFGTMTAAMPGSTRRGRRGGKFFGGESA